MASIGGERSAIPAHRTLRRGAEAEGDQRPDSTSTGRVR